VPRGLAPGVARAGLEPARWMRLGLAPPHSSRRHEAAFGAVLLRSPPLAGGPPALNDNHHTIWGLITNHRAPLSAPRPPPTPRVSTRPPSAPCCSAAPTGNQTAPVPALGPTDPSETKWNEGEDTPIFLVAGARLPALPHPRMRLSARPLRPAAPAHRPPRRDREAACAATSPKATPTANPSRPREPGGTTQVQQVAADRVGADRVGADRVGADRVGPTASRPNRRHSWREPRIPRSIHQEARRYLMRSP